MNAALGWRFKTLSPRSQAAVVDRLISGMADVVCAMSEPLAKVDKVTIVSTGGDAAGVNKLTGDMTKIAAQVQLFSRH